MLFSFSTSLDLFIPPLFVEQVTYLIIGGFFSDKSSFQDRVCDDILLDNDRMETILFLCYTFSKFYLSWLLCIYISSPQYFYEESADSLWSVIIISSFESSYKLVCSTQFRVSGCFFLVQSFFIEFSFFVFKGYQTRK